MSLTDIRDAAEALVKTATVGLGAATVDAGAYGNLLDALARERLERSGAPPVRLSLTILSPRLGRFEVQVADESVTLVDPDGRVWKLPRPSSERVALMVAALVDVCDAEREGAQREGGGGTIALGPGGATAIDMIEFCSRCGKTWVPYAMACSCGSRSCTLRTWSSRQPEETHGGGHK